MVRPRAESEQRRNQPAAASSPRNFLPALVWSATECFWANDESGPRRGAIGRIAKRVGSGGVR
jgi:hypothetical protein